MEKQIKQTDVDTASSDTGQRRDSDTSQISVTSGSRDVSDEVLPQSDSELLAKLEEENRRIQDHVKTRHSRKGSDTSQVSLASGTSSSYEPDSKNAKEIEEDLWVTWGRLVNFWDVEWKRRSDYIKELVRKGVPQHFRSIVWQLLAGVETSPEKKIYANYIKRTSACEKFIRRDVTRTFPEHEMFKKKDGQESLFNVMKAYSLHDREVGYCQGLGFIVGLLLMQLPEEEAFAVLVTIMEKHKLRGMFKPGMNDLSMYMFQFEHLLQEFLPDLYLHFKSQNFATTIYASQWFLTLFTTTLSLELAFRIMEVLICEGIEIVFKVALALLALGKDELLGLDMEYLLQYIKSKLPAKAEEDRDAFLNSAYAIKINQKKLKKLEKEFNAAREKEQADNAQLRCYRNDNEYLRARIALLEKESAELAQILVKGQVDRAEGAEETFDLAREVQELRKVNVELQQRLDSAQDEIRSLGSIVAEHSSREQSLDDTLIASNNVDLARSLQRELIDARLALAERDESERTQADYIMDLESEIKNLRRQAVDNSVAHLQDELIAVKLREAEANLSLKEMRQNVTELSESLTRHIQEHRQDAGPSTVQSNVVSDIMATPKKLLRALDGRSTENMKLEEELLTAKVKMVEAMSELKELRLKMMTLQTEVQVSTNQLRRQDEEAQQLREALEAALKRERALQNKQKEFKHKYADLESKSKYELMQANIKNMEDSQRIAELENQVSEYKLKNEVMVTEGELRINENDSEKYTELKDQICELKAEIMRLKAVSLRNNRFQGSAKMQEDTFKMEDDVDYDHMDYTLASGQRTDSIDLSYLSMKADDNIDVAFDKAVDMKHIPSNDLNDEIVKKPVSSGKEAQNL